MISFIRGLVADTTENAVILENNGIGYEIFMTGSSIEQVSRIDGEVKIHIFRYEKMPCSYMVFFPKMIWKCFAFF